MKVDQIVKQQFGYKTLFTFRVFMYLCKNFNKNFMVSPIFAETLLVLMLYGAQGETFKEIYENLDCIFCSNEDLPESVQVMMNNLTTNRSPLIFSNRILVKRDVLIKQNFIGIAHRFFKVETHFENFFEPELLAEMLDAWLGDLTEDTIETFIPPERISRLNRALLASGVTLLAKWDSPFLTEFTQKRIFFKSKNEIVIVDTMRGRVRCKYCNLEELKVKVINMALNVDASMFFVVPNEREGLGALVEKMDLIFNLDYKKFETKIINLRLPKFQIEQAINYKDIFASCGIRKIFRKLEANLTRMIEENQNFYINGLIQKVFIEVHEYGLGAVEPYYISPAPAAYQKTFSVNHPFAFFIKVGERIVFCGRVVDPSQKTPSCVW